MKAFSGWYRTDRHYPHCVPTSSVYVKCCHCYGLEPCLSIAVLDMCPHGKWVWSVVCVVFSVECGVWSVECGVWRKMRHYLSLGYFSNDGFCSNSL